MRERRLDRRRELQRVVVLRHDHGDVGPHFALHEPAGAQEIERALHGFAQELADRLHGLRREALGLDGRDARALKERAKHRVVLSSQRRDACRGSLRPGWGRAYLGSRLHRRLRPHGLWPHRGLRPHHGLRLRRGVWPHCRFWLRCGFRLGYGRSERREDLRAVIGNGGPRTRLAGREQPKQLVEAAGRKLRRRCRLLGKEIWWQKIGRARTFGPEQVVDARLWRANAGERIVGIRNTRRLSRRSRWLNGWLRRSPARRRRCGGRQEISEWVERAGRSRRRARRRRQWPAARAHGHLEDVVANLDLIPIPEPRLAARAQRPPVDDDRILRAGVGDEVAAGLEGDRGVRARDEPLGIGEDQRVDLPSPDVPPGFLEADQQLPVQWPPLEGDRANRQHSAYLSYLSGTNPRAA